jgi:flagellar M-ring protein FliF
MSDLQQLVASSAGARTERGDIIKVVAVDFVDSEHDLEPQPPPSVGDMLLRQSGTIVNAATILVVTLLLIVSSLDLNPRLQTGRGFSRFFVHRLTP